MTIPPRAPDRREDARAYFFRMARWIVALAAILVIIALALLARQGPLRPAVIGGTIAGVFLSVTIGCGLFAAAFFSDRSGHDQDVGQSRKIDRDD